MDLNKDIQNSLLIIRLRGFTTDAANMIKQKFIPLVDQYNIIPELMSARIENIHDKLSIQGVYDEFDQAIKESLDYYTNVDLEPHQEFIEFSQLKGILSHKGKVWKYVIPKLVLENKGKQVNISFYQGKNKSILIGMPSGSIVPPDAKLMFSKQTFISIRKSFKFEN